MFTSCDGGILPECTQAPARGVLTSVILDPAFEAFEQTEGGAKGQCSGDEESRALLREQALHLIV